MISEILGDPSEHTEVHVAVDLPLLEILQTLAVNAVAADVWSANSW
jgi:hypothetical protein